MLLISYLSEAIVIRHDIEDSKYKALAENYSASVAYIGGCAATVIQPNWIISAAHCLQGKENSIYVARHLDQQYRVNRIIVHPQFTRENDELYDIAIVQLKDPIKNSKPAVIYSGDKELNKQVVFVGRGTFGNGKDGLIRDDGIERAATNTVDSVDQFVIGFTFNAPETATEFEGISSRGDSGGPAFVEQDNKLYLLGVSSYQVSNGFKEGNYGVREFYTRVSTNSGWLTKVLKETEDAYIPKSPVINAIINDDKVALSKALKGNNKLDKDVVNEAFYQSIILSRTSLAKMMLEHGIDATDVEIHGLSVFEFALQQNKQDYYAILQQHFSDKDYVHAAKSKVLPFYVIRFLDSDSLLTGIKMLLSQGANINAQTSNGDTALTIVGWNTRDIDLFQFFVKNGADINIGNNNGDTPLMDAAYLGKIEQLKILLANGADKNLKNKQGKTALDLAKGKNHTEAISLLQQ